jgi:adenylate cyclase
LPIAAALVAAFFVWAAITAVAGRAVDQFEERTGDLVWRLVASHQDEQRLVIVDIDEKSLREIGPWPWQRDTLARLTRKLGALGASLQAYDVVFPDARPDNGRLAAAFAETKPVLAEVFSFDEGSPQSGQLAGALDWPACPPPFSEARGYIANAAGLVPSRAGHITPRVAADGVIRHQPAVVCFGDRAYPALSVGAYMQASGASQLTLTRGEGWLDAPWKLTGLPIPQAGLPLDGHGDMRVPWSLRTESFVSFSAADVLNDRVPPNVFRNAWVLVGSTAFGLADIIATPFSGASAGLQVHAELLLGMLEGRVPTTPARAPIYRALAALVGVLFLVGLSMRRRLSIYAVPLAAIAWGVILFGLHAFAVARWNLWIGWFSPALFTVLAGASLSLFGQARMRFERNRLYTHLSSYLPERVAASLALLPPSSAVNAARQDIVALFADIRNFSAYCESRPAEESAAILHAFYSCATRIVEEEGGVVESFQGDAVLAVWEGDKHTSAPEAALRAAVRLLDESRALLPDPAPEGLEPLALGLGLESGDALVGSFGLARRRAHLAMGRTVTVAIRLVSMTVDLAHPILIGEGLAARLDGAPLESMGTFLLDGMRTPHHIYAYPLAG